MRTAALSSARWRAWIRTAPRGADAAEAAARKSGRFLRRSIVRGAASASATETSLRVSPLGGQALAALGPAALDDLAAVGGGHARAIAVTALTHESRRLIGALHRAGSGGARKRRGG